MPDKNGYKVMLTQHDNQKRQTFWLLAAVGAAVAAPWIRRPWSYLFYAMGVLGGLKAINLSGQNANENGKNSLAEKTLQKYTVSIPNLSDAKELSDVTWKDKIGDSALDSSRCR